MKIETDTFKNILESAAAGLAKKDELEQGRCFAFMGNRVCTYNDSVAVSVPFKSGITGAVTADKLLRFLSRVKDPALDISAAKGELHVKGKRVRCGLPLAEEIALPLKEIKPPKEFTPLPERFSAAVRFCQFSASRDQNKPTLCHVHIDDTHAESCDNFRLSRYDLGGEVAEMLLPVDRVAPLLAFQPVEYGVDESGWVHFRAEDHKAIWSCRVGAGEFPDLDKLLKVKGASVTFPSDLEEILERTRIFTNDDDALAEVLLTPKGVEIRGRGESGWIRERARLKEPVESELSFAAHPQMLIDIAGMTDTCVVGSGRMLLSGDHFTHVVCLKMRESE